MHPRRMRALAAAMHDGRFPAARPTRPAAAEQAAAHARPSRPAAAEQAAAAAPPRSSPLVMDRFRAMLRDREEELRADAGVDDVDVPPPTAHEIVRMYEELLAELTFNSKVVITELTMIADEQRKHAEGIADAICSRILEAPVDHKLPSLYLLDSIVKNVGHEYVRCFAARLPKVFIEAYHQVTSNLYPSMRHLFGTWSQYFPMSVLRKIEDELQLSTENKRPTGLADARHSESPSSRPSHGIHVNPKYLETRRQLDHSAAMPVVASSSDARPMAFEEEPMEGTASESPKGLSGASSKFHDIELMRGVSSSLHPYRHKSTMPYGDVDFDHTMILPPRPGRARVRSPRTAAMRMSSTVGVEGPLSLSKGMGSKPPSPRFGLGRPISPTGDRFHRDISPGRFLDSASPSHSGFGLGPGIVNDQNCLLERRWTLGDGDQQREGSIGYNIKNGHSKHHSRKLIDAYGDYRRDDASHEKHPKVQRLDVNGISNEAATRKWQSSEEDEYVWEDMSPTLADRSNRNSLQPFVRLNARVGLGRSDDRFLNSDFKKDIWPDPAPLHRVDDPAINVEDRIPFRRSAHGSMNKKYLDGSGIQNEALQHYQSINHMEEPRRFPYSSSQYPHQSLSPKSRGLGHHAHFSLSGIIPSIAQKLPCTYESFPEANLPFRRLSNIDSDTSNIDTSDMDNHLAQGPYSPSAAPVLWPPMHKYHPSSFVPIPPSQKSFKSHFDIIEDKKPILNQGLNSSIFFPQQKYAAAERKTTSSCKQVQIPYQPSRLIYANQQSSEPGSVQVQPKDPHGSHIQSTAAHLSSHLVPQSLNHVQTQTHGGAMVSDIASSFSGVISSVGMHSTPATSLHVQGGILPPLPPGPPPASSQMGPSSQSNSSIISSSPAIVISGLYDTLVAQGYISFNPTGQSQDTLGVEFDAELLKVRHESAINSLYTDLTRQCTTCGLRFKSQEEHSNHMDWHVIKNRISKNRKQKPSRKWFVSAKEWLSGAETLGTDVVPGFLPNEPVLEKKEDKEMAVPADENQNVCALCGDPFEDFYSDETEEWMYKGAVYLNAPTGVIEGLDRSQLGPIVHSKCRSEPADDNGQA